MKCRIFRSLMSVTLCLVLIMSVVVTGVPAVAVEKRSGAADVDANDLFEFDVSESGIDVVKLKISLKSGANLVAASLNIAFDSTVITYGEWVFNDTQSGIISTCEPKASTPGILVYAIAASKRISTSRLLATITFNVADYSEKSTTLTVTAKDIYNCESTDTNGDHPVNITSSFNEVNCTAHIWDNVSGVQISKTTLALDIGGSDTLTATVLPVIAKNKNVVWQSDNPAIATVSTSGVVTAVAKGATKIRVTTVDGGFIAECAVSVACVHTWGDYTVYTAATCEHEGSERRVCAVCGSEEFRPIAILRHTPGAAATCTEPQVCTVCDTVIAGALGHNFSTAWTVDVAPTCETKGSKSHHCSRCDERQNVTPIAELPHTEGAVATCTTAQVCTVCNTVLVEALGHDFSSEWTIDVAATCVATGSKSHHCSRCDEVEDVTVISIDDNAHKFSAEWTIDVAPTEEAEGSKSHHCTLCGDIDISSVTAIPVLSANLTLVDDSPLSVSPDGIVDGFNPGTTVSDILDEFVNDDAIIVDASGAELEADDLVGSGDRIVIMDGDDERDSLTLYLLGDVNGDGKVNTDDARITLRVAVGLDSVEGIFLKAAKVLSAEGRPVSTDDARKILRVAVGLDVFAR